MQHSLRSLLRNAIHCILTHKALKLALVPKQSLTISISSLSSLVLFKPDVDQFALLLLSYYSATMSIKQLRAVQQGGPFAIVTVPPPRPGPHEVCIRPRAVSLNPVDFKNLRYSVAIRKWPAVLGIEGAGIVESVGEGVASLKTGDEVVSLVETKYHDGVFQELYIAQEVSCMKKPTILSFEEATSLP